MWWQRIWNMIMCVPKFDAQGEARNIFMKIGLPEYEAAVEAKIVEYLYKFVSDDFKLAFSPKVVVCSLVTDRLKSGLVRFSHVDLQGVAAAAGVPSESIEEIIKRGSKLTI